MEDFYKLWRNELLKDMRSKRSSTMRSIDSLKNVGSVYYDSQVAYAKMVNDICKLIEASPETIGEYREVRDYGGLLAEDNKK